MPRLQRGFFSPGRDAPALRFGLSEKRSHSGTRTLFITDEFSAFPLIFRAFFGVFGLPGPKSGGLFVIMEPIRKHKGIP